MWARTERREREDRERRRKSTKPYTQSETERLLSIHILNSYKPRRRAASHASQKPRDKQYDNLVQIHREQTVGG